MALVYTCRALINSSKQLIHQRPRASGLLDECNTANIRGSRGGRKIQRNILVRCTTREVGDFPDHGINVNNLVYIKTESAGDNITETFRNIPTLITSRNNDKTENQCSDPSNVVSVPIDKYRLPTFLNANVRSVVNKLDDLTVVLKQNNVDIACLTETWLNDNVPNEVLSIPGYNAFRNDRKGRLGGGVAVLIEESYPVKLWPELQNPELETLWVSIRPPKMPRCFSHITFGVMYHPPKAYNKPMADHLSSSLDTIIQAHPSTV